MIGSKDVERLGNGSTGKYTLTNSELLDEYFNFSNKERFGQYIVNKYMPEGFDSLVFYEPSNGMALKYILNRLFQQNLEESKFTS